MTWLGRHPGTRLLGQYADEELDREARGRVYAHLAGCPNCRKRVEFIHALGGAAADLPHPRPPDGVLEEILRRRREGDRVILPLELETPGPRSRLAVRSAVAAILALVTGFAALVLFAPQATAGRSMLAFSAVTSPVGELVEVVYRPSLELATDPVVRLRVRWRAATDDPPRDGPLGRLVETVLERDGDGLYRGEFRLPLSAVVWTGSVESMSGDRVDSNAGRLWDGVALSEDDRPSLEALIQSYRLFEPRSGVAALEAAREITRHYPESAEGWSLLLAAERRTLGDADLQRRTIIHSERFLELYRDHVRHLDTSPAELIALQRYARGVGDEEARTHVERELQVDYPKHPTAVEHRLAVYAERFDSEPGRLLAAVEAEWLVYGPVSERLLRDGVRAAIAAGQPERVNAWVDRYERSGEDRTWLANRMAERPDLAERRIAILKTEVARYAGVESVDRRLFESRADAEVRVGDLQRGARVELGRALVETGRCAEGVEQLQASVARGWSPEAFGALAAALHTCGDDQAALPYHVLVAADPLTSPDSIVALRRAMEPALRPGQWETLIESAKRQFLARMSDLSAPGRLLSPGAQLLDEDGTRRSLSELLDGQSTLLVLWDRLGGTSQEILDGLNELALTGSAHLLVVTAEEPNAELSAFAAERVRFRLVHDHEGDLLAQVAVFRRPYLLVLDRAGRIVYSPDELDDALRGLEALQE